MGKLAVQAQCDGLTRLLARNHVCEEIKYHLLALDKKKAASFVLNSDTFKKISDNYGHLYGDKMLRVAAARLKSSVHSSGIVARAGGDKFLVYMECEVDIERLVEHIFRKVSGLYDRFEAPVGVGVALASGGDVTYGELFFHTDRTLYARKHARKNQYRLYDDSVQSILLSQPE